MQKAKNVIEAINKLGRLNVPLTRVYRQLFNEDMYLCAYSNLYTNKGALTPGIDGVSIQGMSRKRIERIIEQMRKEKFRFKPSKRQWIPKKKGGKRPLGITSGNDKLVQEVLRLILNAYYDPQFSDNSHGFRPGLGCHTALKQIVKTFRGAIWFIEGDIKGCFDNIDHDVLMEILRRKIHDNRLLRLIRQGLKAGIIDDWKYEQTYSGTTQGSVLSPLLANIYMNELDCFVENELIPKWNKGKYRKRSEEYSKARNQYYKAKRSGNQEDIKRTRKQMQSIPYGEPESPNFKRLKYVRYADDFLLAFVGSKAEAKEIKAEIGQFLNRELKLIMSDSKTKITHASTDQAVFLGYALSKMNADNKMAKVGGIKQRSTNGEMALRIPKGLIRRRIKDYMENGRARTLSFWLDLSDFEMITQAQNVYRGLAEYYKFALDRRRLGGFKYVLEQCLVFTLARKYKSSQKKIYRKYADKRKTDGKVYKTLAVTYKTKTGERKAHFGGIPLTYSHDWKKPLSDKIVKPLIKPQKDIIRRLLVEKCEVCGYKANNLQVHHVRKLSNLQKKWRNRKKQPPKWVSSMIALRRKTLVVCIKCHREIDCGKYNGQHKKLPT
jgi:group II intron reverse transcriptase/maturase